MIATRFETLFFLTAVCLWPSLAICAQTITVDTKSASGDLQQGTRSDASATRGTSYITGQVNQLQFRGFLTFNLSTVQVPIAAATLEIVQGVNETPDSFETVELYDVTTPAAQLPEMSASPAIYNDLGTGVIYGASSDFMDGVDFSSVKSINLNSAAVGAINANLGSLFSIGLSLTSIQGPNEQLLFDITGSQMPVLVLTLVPEPSAFAIASTSLIGLSAIRRRR